MTDVERLKAVCNDQQRQILVLRNMLVRLYDRADIESAMHAMRSEMYDDGSYHTMLVEPPAGYEPFKEVIDG